MPAVDIDAPTLARLVGGKAGEDELAEALPRMGAVLDRREGDVWTVELSANRPDLFSVEGLARGLRAFLGVEAGGKTYPVAPARVTLTVDPTVLAVRPAIACAFVRRAAVDDERIRALMELQEDLHWGLGARRAKVSIGVHDAARLAPPFVYRGARPGDVRFVPLQSDEEMDLRAILERHPKGRDFAHLLVGHERYPVIEDARGTVLSFPPIINGTATTVTPATRDLFLDVTGTDPAGVRRALSILAANFAEQGGEIEAVRIETPSGTTTTPDLSSERRRLPVDAAPRLLGLPIPPEEQAEALRRMGHAARVAAGAIEVEVPAFRADVLHEVDLVEDVAIGHGFSRLTGVRPRAVTFGARHPIERAARRWRDVLVGLGFLEAMTLTLTNERESFGNLGGPEAPHVSLANPITEDHTILRTSLIPSLLAILRRNVHRDLPQRLFEVGDVVGRSDGALEQRTVAAGVLASSRASFSDAKGLVEAMSRDLSLGADLAAAEAPGFVPGRCGALLVSGRRLGVFGEVAPATVVAFELANPVVAFEFEVQNH
ncbi:MAG: phenylalanine--tRNA ligase subunit beta [Methanobacteriota archaeon]